MTMDVLPAKGMALDPEEFETYRWYCEDRHAPRYEPILARCYPKFNDAYRLTSVWEVLVSIAEHRWPGCLVFGDRRIIADYLHQRAQQVMPLFVGIGVGPLWVRISLENSL
jgi:hypothetical protein